MGGSVADRHDHQADGEEECCPLIVRDQPNFSKAGGDVEACDRNTLVAARLSRLSQRSIFNEAALEAMDKALAPQTVDKIVESPVGLVLQGALFIMSSLVLGLAPLITQLSLWDPVKQAKVMEYNPQTVWLAQYLTTVLICQVSSFIFIGFRKGYLRCFSFTNLVKYGPVGILHACSESQEILTMNFLDGGLRMILNQFKLPMCAVLRTLIYGIHLPASQWFSIAAVIVSVVGFVLRDAILTAAAAAAHSLTGAPTNDGSVKKLCIGVAIALFCVFMSTCSFVYSDRAFKGSRTPYLVEIHCIRFPSILVMLVAMVAYCYFTDTFWKLPFHGWTWGVGFLVFWYTLKDFSQSYTIKALNSFWLALAYSAGLCIAYLADIVFMGKQADSISIAFIMIVACLIVSFSLNKKPAEASH